MRLHYKEIKRVQRKKICIAGALSKPQAKQLKSRIDDDEIQAHIANVISPLPASDVRLQQIMEAQKEYPVCRQIKAYCCEVWLNHYSLNDAMKPCNLRRLNSQWCRSFCSKYPGL